jgi:hypothetical protein
MNQQREEFIRGLRELADFYERTPGMPLPSETSTSFYLWPNSSDSVGKLAKLLAPAKKEFSSSFFTLSRKFGSIKLEISWYKEDVCERVVTGQKQAVEKVPVAYEDRIVTRDIVEWRCPESILQDKSEKETQDGYQSGTTA